MNNISTFENKLIILFGILFCALFFMTEGGFIVEMDLNDYNNPYDLKADSTRCEIITLGNDNCDPFFRACLGSKPKTCNLINYFTEVFVDERFVQNIARLQASLESIPKWLYLRVDIYDRELTSSAELIAVLEQKIDTSNSSFPIYVLMEDANDGSIRLQVKIKFKCESYFYGPDCTKLCNNETVDVDCVKECPLNCQNDGACIQSETRVYCNCSDGWTGDLCTDIVIFNIPSTEAPTNKEQIKSTPKFYDNYDLKMYKSLTEEMKVKPILQSNLKAESRKKTLLIITITTALFCGLAIIFSITSVVIIQKKKKKMIEDHKARRSRSRPSPRTRTRSSSRTQRTIV